jgi:uncharacterized protein YndB with AHSA1/START domain
VIEPIELSFEVECEPAHAFEVWTERTSMWWPVTHTVSTEPGVEVRFEPHVGGRIFERTRAGEEHDWGQILEWEPPKRVVYRWHLRQDRADATEVEIRFLPAESAGTRVEIEHRGWEQLGAAAEARRDGNYAGWGGLLPHFVAACAITPGSGDPVAA